MTDTLVVSAIPKFRSSPATQQNSDDVRNTDVRYTDVRNTEVLISSIILSPIQDEKKKIIRNSIICLCTAAKS